MPLVVALVDQGIALFCIQLDQALESLRITRNQGRPAKEGRMFLHTMSLSPFSCVGDGLFV